MLHLANGLIYDGSGAAPFPGSVLVEADRIRGLGPLTPPPDCETIDCAGLAIAPGFIDLHSHSDVQLLEDRDEKLKQGVTTEVVGNCGFSPFPQSGNGALLHEFGAGILGRGPWGWNTAAAYFQALNASPSRVRALPLIGHGSLRVAVMGLRQEPPTAAELDRMTGLLEDALDAGCVGFSTGLMYAPGSCAARAELLHFCQTVARRDKLYATHMRSYAAGLVDAVREQLDLARASGCRLQISHLQCAGRANWSLQQPALDEIETARAQGLDVEFDIYPYQCGSTVLTQWLPQWAMDGGTDAMLARLANPDARARITAAVERDRAQQWDDITISAVASSANASLVGQTLAAVAAARGADPAATLIQLLLEEQAAVNVISFNQSEDNLRQLLTHPLCSVISDGFYVNGKPHPRLHGTFPELLGAVVRRRRWMSLEQAIHKVTAKPAARLRAPGRGRLVPGAAADFTLFDPARIASHATYDDPARDPSGIVRVIRDGRVVL